MFILYDKISGKVLSAIKNEKIAKACVGTLPDALTLDITEIKCEPLDPQKSYRLVRGKLIALPKPHMQIEYDGGDIIKPGELVKMSVLCLDEFGELDLPRFTPHLRLRQTRWSKKLDKCSRNDFEFQMPILCRKTDHFVALCHPYEEATLKVTHGQQGTA